MPGTPYLCEANGARIIRCLTGLVQIDDDFQVDFTTWDKAPAGEMGEVMFRVIDIAGKMTNGVHLGVTPMVDGTSLGEQQFHLLGTGEWQIRAYFGQRGTRVASRIRTLSRTGDVEFHNVRAVYTPLRSVP